MTDEPFPDDEVDDSLPLRELHRLAGGACVECGTRYSARDAVGSVALGFKNAPRCLVCLARRLGRGEPDLREQLTDYVHRRECYLKAWREAERMDAAKHPHPPTPSPTRLEDSAEERGRKAALCHPLSSAPEGSAWERGPGGEGVPHWDAGDMGCGELVMALRLRMNNLPPGGVIRITAADPAAPEDLPAWCRLCGHTLVGVSHPDYWIRRKGD